MTAFTLVQLSDTHLSASRPFFQFNYEIVLEALADVKPDHVVITGDLGLNGPDDIDDVAYARRQFDRLPCPWNAVPGNHDLGLVPFEGGLHQPINAERHALYVAAMGADRFATPLADWHFVGINSQLLGSGMQAEFDQHEWLAETLANTDRPTALFLHYPLFLDAIDDSEPSHSVVHPEARRRMLDLIAANPQVKLVASGHLHEDRRIERAGVVYQWAPSTAFVTTENNHGGVPNAGFLVYRFDGATFSVERIEPHWIINHDIRNWGRSQPHGYYEIVKRPFPVIG